MKQIRMLQIYGTVGTQDLQERWKGELDAIEQEVHTVV